VSNPGVNTSLTAITINQRDANQANPFSLAAMCRRRRGRLVNIALATIFDLASAFTEPATAGSASPWPSAQRHRKRGWSIFTSLSCLWIRSSWAIWRIRSASEANVP